MQNQKLLQTIRSQIKAASSPERAAGIRAYFHEPVDPSGVAAPQLKQIARLVYREIKPWPVEDRDRLMEGLWKSGSLEEGAIVCYVYRRFSKSCAEREFEMFEKWIDRYVGNWAHCDGVSSWLVAASIANRPRLTAKLARWTKSKHRWKRRAAAVSLVKEARAGRNTEAILQICALLRDDADDMVQKGVGWLLKETYPLKPREVIRFLDDWRGIAPRLVLRIAAEKLTAQDKKWLLTK
jgi:3-methyladenine DNA glycosylase AlkD